MSRRRSSVGKERKVDFTLSTKPAPVPVSIPIETTPLGAGFIDYPVEEAPMRARRKTYQPDGREKLSLPGYCGAYISGVTGNYGITLCFFFVFTRWKSLFLCIG